MTRLRIKRMLFVAWCRFTWARDDRDLWRMMRQRGEVVNWRLLKRKLNY